MTKPPVKKTAIEIFNNLGLETLPENDTWAHRFQIKSGTASRLYVIGKHRETGMWVCSCPGFRSHRHCKHMSAVSSTTSEVDRVDGIPIMLASAKKFEKDVLPTPDDDMFPDIEPERRPFSDDGYRHYDTATGLGSSEEWERMAEDIFARLGINDDDYTTYASQSWRFANASSQHSGERRTNPKYRPSNPLLIILDLEAIPDTLASFKTAARKRMFRAHPDRGGSADEFREVFAAYEKLAWDVFKVKV
jgi:hypothetical protein